MAKSPRRRKARLNPYARFGKIHDVCPDLVNFFHYVENPKPGVREDIAVADLKRGLIVLAKNCQELIGKFGKGFWVSAEWTESNVPGAWDQVAGVLAEAEHTPWHQPPEWVVRPGTTQTSELLELAVYGFEVGIAKGDQITLGEMAERIEAMRKVLDDCGEVPGETLGELDERQDSPDFQIDQTC